MSRYFVSDAPVPVPEFEGPGEGTPPNVIYIRPRMDVETRAKVKNELFTIAADGKTPELRAGMNELALLLHNVVKWEGPDLGSVPCTPATIRTLDPNEPHIARVLEEIGRRNEPRPSPDPKSVAANGSMSGTKLEPSRPERANESVGQQLATMTWRSPLPSDSDGPPSRSENSTPTT